MKNITYKIIGILMAFVMVLPSCKDNFQEINTNPNGAPDALPSQLLAPALVSLVGTNMLRNRNFNNELMQVTVNQSDDEQAVFRYDFRRNNSDNTWNNWYIQLTNLKDIYKNADKMSANEAKTYKAVSLILQSWTYSLLTDTYGDVPYFESNMAKDSSIYEPKFDTQKAIYTDIFLKLEEANELLKTGAAITAASDPIYGGVAAAWRRFSNCLYLRLLLRVSGKAEVSADVIAKIKEMVDTNSGNYPRITNNSQSAILKWNGMGPYTSPFMLSVRAQDFRSPAIASFFIDPLRNWFSPLLNLGTYGINSTPRLGINPSAKTFTGVPSGFIPGQGIPTNAYFYSYDQLNGTLPVTSLQNDAMTGMIMNFSEVQFILAECAAKGFIAGSAENFWKTGILNYITLWLPNWPNATALNSPPNPAMTITSQPFLDYLTGGDILFGSTLPVQMQSIHQQKYYSLFMVDFQQWFEYRRTGYPVLPKGPGLRNNGMMPARMTYPVYVESANPTNYKAAIAAQGPDQINTQVWWQKP
ncbi:SusD/RagB family nutrient-binding outer membrane lipoprotein [Pedobacter heparinus]|uniref:SusD/RagB family nutrient-binding outer membrane lipoprotein n=1 Tax=Pedobacter heparinus TaxID=984 RepID=UPI002930725F|nr:SusD/RagB family nutrient-binding outer membrane lipoprotein [Pedobacter heparinus]